MKPEHTQTLPGLSGDDTLLLLRSATELAFNSILITDTDHNILYANPAF